MAETIRVPHKPDPQAARRLIESHEKLIADITRLLANAESSTGEDRQALLFLFHRHYQPRYNEGVSEISSREQVEARRAREQLKQVIADLRLYLFGSDDPLPAPHSAEWRTAEFRYPMFPYGYISGFPDRNTHTGTVVEWLGRHVERLQRDISATCNLDYTQAADTHIPPENLLSSTNAEIPEHLTKKEWKDGQWYVLLKRIRQDVGQTQEEAAEECKVTVVSWKVWERKENPAIPNPNNRRALLAYM